MVRKKILVVEDDEDIRNLIVFNLGLENLYDILQAGTGEEAVGIIQRQMPDLVILDIMLPGIDGFEVCRIIKGNIATKRIPVVMLTARSDDSDVVKGYELGVEDYLRKPFSSMKILLARVSNILKRTSPEDNRIKLGDLELDSQSYSVVAAGERVELSFSEFKILQLLVENPGIAYSREEIMSVVKAGKNAPEPKTMRTIDVQVLALRKKLGKCSRYIQTVRSAGYMIQI